MNEYIVKVKMPAEIVIHMPAFSEIAAHDMLRHITGDSSRKIIQDKINTLLVNAFMDSHKKEIDSFIIETLSKGRGENILELVRDELIRKLSD